MHNGPRGSPQTVRTRDESHDASEQRELHASEPESELITACQQGELDANRRLYERYTQQVYRLMYRMVGGENADDLTQQVFLRVLTTIGQYSGRSKFGTWLYRVACNEALQHLRRNAKRQCQTIPLDPIDHHSSAFGRIDDREMLEHALARIDPELRTVFLLREIEQMSYYDIAMTLDIAEGTVASRLNRARRELRQLVTFE